MVKANKQTNCQCHLMNKKPEKNTENKITRRNKPKLFFFVLEGLKLCRCVFRSFTISPPPNHAPPPLPAHLALALSACSSLCSCPSRTRIDNDSPEMPATARPVTSSSPFPLAPPLSPFGRHHRVPPSIRIQSDKGVKPLSFLRLNSIRQPMPTGTGQTTTPSPSHPLPPSLFPSQTSNLPSSPSPPHLTHAITA